jgi:hypothetical protein
VLAVFGTVWLSLDIWKRYNTSPTAISMERNFMDWATDLPSGTLCPLEKVDEDKLQAYVDRYYNIPWLRSNLPTPNPWPRPGLNPGQLDFVNL